MASGAGGMAAPESCRLTLHPAAFRITRSERYLGLLTHYPYYAQLALTLAVRAFNLATQKRCSGYERMLPFIEGKTGLEIGGPSNLFRANHLIPVYERANAVDSSNFSDKTVWTREREREAFGKSLRDTFVCDATDMGLFQDASYDFVLACHVLEHIANPLQALSQWKRLVKPGGAVLIIVPHKSRTFDNRRSFTTMQHLVEDFEKQTPESDLTHLEEILQLHDWRKDLGGGGPEHFRARCLANVENRCMHHHVYSPELLGQCFQFCGLETVNLTVEYPYHIIGMAHKPSATPPRP